MSVKVSNIMSGHRTYLGGAPRSKGSGQVFFFQPNDVDLRLELKVTLTGEKFGSYFGHDLVVADFNSDG